jgi:membrane-associated PAP2 superfamily phosphatase
MDRVHWQDGRDLLTRTVAPGVVLFGLLAGFGLLLNGPLKAVDEAEDKVTDAFNRNRTDFWDPISWVCSRIGNTEVVIAACLLAVGLIWWRTREWRWAAVPLISISLQATIFLFLTLAVGRQRPPAIPMDASPPTSSYPSGHTGASTALYFSLLLLAAARIERDWPRRVLMTGCAVIPFLVGTARLYRGAHHISDVLAGMLNGVVCAVLAYQWYRHRVRSEATSRQLVSAGRVS